MAAKYWPGKDAVGQRLKVKDKWMEIVGVAKNANYRTKLEQPTPFFYVPVRQNFVVQNGFIIRTDQSAAAIMKAFAREIHELNPNLAPLDTISLQEQVDRMSYTQRLTAALLAIFGGMALFLAAIGLYGVMSYSVSQSTRELGLRMALGANIADLLRLVMSRGLVLTAGGIALGCLAAFLLTGLMRTILFKVSPRDPLAFGFAFLVMALVAIVACFLPAWRAARIDPVQALRI
jgi:ABC-type antimicrobial peptide transport system permease subunit